MAALTVTRLAIYPVKSLAGIALQEMTLGARGPEFDRHWLVADPHGQFITQRQRPRMCLVRTALQDGVLTLSAPGVEPLRLPIAAAEGKRSSVTVWRDGAEAIVRLVAAAGGPIADVASLRRSGAGDPATCSG